MQKYTFLIAALMLTFLSLNAQKTVAPAKKTDVDRSTITINTDHRSQVPKSAPSIFDIQTSNHQPLHFRKSIQETKLRFSNDKKTGLPIMISGTLETPNRSASTTIKCFEYLDAIQSVIQIENPDEEFVLRKETTDKKGTKHLRFDQYYNGIKVHHGEVVLHEKEDAIFLFNGRNYPTPQLENIEPSISLAEAELIVKNDHPNWQELSADQHIFIPHEQLKSELVIFHENKKVGQEKLVWHFTAIPNITEQWAYFIDAQTGEILEKYSKICQIHGGFCKSETHDHEPAISENKNEINTNLPFGPETAQATDLQGINRTINVYETGGTFYMVDASRPMFNASQSNMPNSPSGAVWTIDAFNSSPENSNFSYDHVTSSNNSWNNPTAVSAQYNGGIAYQYFKNTFGRESINGQGGNIVSFINVADGNGGDMDNAFWNGTAMFYGNGDQAFTAPLAKSLDVAGHEMSHGVIQNEANLAYQFESGALNESFADIFGAMIDRNDWKIGEEVANSSIFPTGTMRDMENPHNGGTSSDFYWQPMHVNEMYTGSQDNGGVHINSGIPNHAYYLFATAIGKDDAEQIFYDALANYLVASSQFIDLRAAVVQATIQEFGNGSSQVDAANNAFNAVGIGEGGGNDYQEDVSVNPGDDFIMWSDLGLSTVNNSQTDGTLDGTISNTDHISRPSVSDDGQFVQFVNTSNQIVEVNIDWSTGEIVSESVIQSETIWRNVAISKDGSKLAAITTDNDNDVYVFDFNTGTSQWFTLYNPTSAEGVSTGDVQFPDVLEWDFSGEQIIYDAQNVINGQSGSIEYWDIGFIKVWENNTDNFSQGQVSKLFTGLPENVSVGNPTFSKNSPYIIAFDFIESTTQGVNYEVLGANIQTGDQGTIWESNTLGYPSFSIDDSRILFSFLNNGTDQIIGVRDLGADKISGIGDASLLIEEAEWAIWFATGERGLTSYEDLKNELGIAVYPNPVRDVLTIEWSSADIIDARYELYDLTGRMVNSGIVTSQQSSVNVSGLTSGTYVLRVIDGEQMGVMKVVKM